MATNPPGKGKATVACYVPEHIAAEIKRRADRLEWTVSKYAGKLLEQWYERGCAPISDMETLLVNPQFKYPEASGTGLTAAEAPAQQDHDAMAQRKGIRKSRSR